MHASLPGASRLASVIFNDAIWTHPHKAARRERYREEVVKQVDGKYAVRQDTSCRKLLEQCKWGCPARC